MSPLVACLEFALGGVLLLAGAEGLVRGGTALALRFQITPLVIGMTVVAFGTSAPELGVSVDAALGGDSDVALGNVVGSNVCNIGLILGVCALIRPLHVHQRLIRLDLPLLVLVSLALVWLLADGRVSRPEAGLLLVGLVAHTGFSLVEGRRAGADGEFAEGLQSGTFGCPAVVLVALGLGALLVGADLFVASASSLARLFGVPESAIALTLVALGTSLPELATSALAAMRGNADIAVGNIVGSNLFNILGVLGLSAVVSPLDAGGLGQLDLWVMLGFAIVLLPLLRTRLRLERWEGATLLAAYLGYSAFLLGG